MIKLIKTILFIIGGIIIAAVVICLTFYLFDIMGSFFRGVGIPISNDPLSPEDIFSFFE